MHTDPLFYRLFQERPTLAFALAGLEAPAGVRYRMQAVEVKQTAFRLDGVLVPAETDQEAPLVFTEAQFQSRETFYARWLAAIFLYLYRHRVTRPWQAIVVYPQRQADTGEWRPYEPLLRCGLLHRVYLEDLLDAPALGFEARLARLIVLDPERVPAEARALVAQPDPNPAADPLEVLDLVETILVYKFPQLTREEIRAMLHLPETNLKKTRFYQEAFGEGRHEGRQEGRQEGRLEGRREEGARLLRRQLTKRFGPLPAWAEQHLRHASPERLEEWADRILEADTLEAVLRP